MKRKIKDFLLKVQIDRSEVPKLTKFHSFLDILDEADRPEEAVVLFGATTKGVRTLVRMADMLQKGHYTDLVPTCVTIEYHGEFARPYTNILQHE
jgi:hypothetical protein